MQLYGVIVFQYHWMVPSCHCMYAGSEKDLLQSADLAILLTASKANGGIGGQVDLLCSGSIPISLKWKRINSIWGIVIRTDSQFLNLMNWPTKCQGGRRGPAEEPWQVALRMDVQELQERLRTRVGASSRRQEKEIYIDTSLYHVLFYYEVAWNPQFGMHTTSERDICPTEFADLKKFNDLIET